MYPKFEKKKNCEQKIKKTNDRLKRLFLSRFDDCGRIIILRKKIRKKKQKSNEQYLPEIRDGFMHFDLSTEIRYKKNKSFQNISGYLV